MTQLFMVYAIPKFLLCEIMTRNVFNFITSAHFWFISGVLMLQSVTCSAVSGFVRPLICQDLDQIFRPHLVRQGRLLDNLVVRPVNYLYALLYGSLLCTGRQDQHAFVVLLYPSTLSLLW